MDDQENHSSRLLSLGRTVQYASVAFDSSNPVFITVPFAIQVITKSSTTNFLAPGIASKRNTAAFLSCSTCHDPETTGRLLHTSIRTHWIAIFSVQSARANAATRVRIQAFVKQLLSTHHFEAFPQPPFRVDDNLDSRDTVVSESCVFMHL